MSGSGGRWPGRYPWRAGLLLLDGILRFVLVAEFDVLMGYAVIGIVVAFLLATSEGTQRAWMVTASAAHLLLLSLVTAALLTQPASAPAGPLQPNPYAAGSFGDLVAFRLENLLLFRLEPMFIFWLSVAIFLAGSQLVRQGVLEAPGHRLRVRLMAIGAAAFPLDLLLGLDGGSILPGVDGAAAGIVLGRYGSAGHDRDLRRRRGAYYSSGNSVAAAVPNRLVPELSRAVTRDENRVPGRSIR